MRYRNLIATSPLLRKGGVHDKSNRAKRLAAKNQLRRDLLKATAAPDKST